MEMFAQIRLVLPVADGETFVLGRDPETISIKEILDCVRHSGKKIKAANARDSADDEINALLQDIDDSISKALAGKSLQAVILHLPPPAL